MTIRDLTDEELKYADREILVKWVTDLQKERAQLGEIGEMQIIEHEGNRLRVIPMALHDRLCTVRVASAQGTTPEVLHCHFCGFCYPRPAGAR